MPNIELSGRARLSPFRHISLGTWKTAYDPSIYGALTLPMDETLRYLEAFRAATGLRLTVTHLMAKAMGAVLQGVPEANAILRWNRIYLRREIGLFFQVAIEDPTTGAIDLSGVKVDAPERKPLADIVTEFERNAAKVRARDKTQALERSRGGLLRIPGAMIGWTMRLLSFLNYTLNLDLGWAGIPRDPFGGAMITNIGSLGLQGAYVPLVPFSRVPILVAMGSVDDAPVVREGKLAVGKTMQLFATFDHRVVDGVHAAKMVKILRAWFERPFEHFDAIPNPPALPPAG
ncbi:MAG: 2-oxo acid dehydrogenase subunit E2 [Nannocystaceae bacterium]|nr:2-oxo acid dehydrogenase subunit E2 [Nannocystaceae bacterium]